MFLYKQFDDTINIITEPNVSYYIQNTPNDLQLLSDAPAHRLFVLLGPIDAASAGALPEILCVVQICLEGEISQDSVRAGLSRGVRAAGDLIPWTLSQQVPIIPAYYIQRY